MRSWYTPLGSEPEDARPWPGKEPEDEIPKAYRRAQKAEKASPATVPGLAYAARKPTAAGPAPAARPGLNACSLLSVTALVLCPPASVLLGGLALYQIRRSGERGTGMAVLAVALGALLTLILAGLCVFVLSIGDWPAPQ